MLSRLMSTKLESSRLHRLWTWNVSAAHVARECARGPRSAVLATVFLATWLLVDPSASHASTRTPESKDSLSYLLIPFGPSDLLQGVPAGLMVNGVGDTVAVGGSRNGKIRVIFRNEARGERVLSIPPLASEGQQLTRDGRQMFFRGAFTVPPGNSQLDAIGSVTLGTGAVTIGPATDSEFFRVDATGRRVAFQSVRDLDPSVGNPDRTLQYFVYDHAGGNVTQLTTDPRSAEWNSDRLFCPRILGTTPLITADGSRVIVITSVTLDLVPLDPNVGCYIFEYQVDDRSWRYVAGLPRGLSLDTATLSNDGRWLSFTSVRVVPPGIRRSFPALLNVESGDLIDPVGDISDVPSFDAVVTGDGSKVVVSSQADLDPSVGNADGNMELFLYDREADRFEQITDTTGGIGSTPGGCPNYRPVVNDDGNVVLFPFMLFTGGGCRLDGPQRARSNGLAFGRIRAVRKRPGNHGPRFTAREHLFVVPGEYLKLNFAAVDPDGDRITFFAQELDGLTPPPGSEFVDDHDGSATFTWPTGEEDAGEYTMRVAAFDEGGGEVFHDVRITVKAPFCLGDCDGDDRVSVGELITGVKIASGEGGSDCDAFDGDRDDAVRIDELVQATRNSIEGCRDDAPANR